MSEIEGVLPVVSTPFDGQWRLDRHALAAEVDWLLDHGADGVTVAMVSEVLRLTHEERRELTEAVVTTVQGRAISVVSVGGESTDQALALTAHAVSVGADAVMANPPLTVAALSDEQLLSYFSAIADAAGDVPLIVQDASGYIGTPLSLETLVELHSRYGPVKVQFKPEAQPLGGRLSALLEMTDGTARVFEGSGGLALVDNYQRGIVGSMPGPDLVWAIVPLWRALVDGDLERAYRIQECLSPVLNLVSGLDSYIAMEKHLLHRQGVLPSDRQRQPVGFVLDDQTREELDRLVDRLSVAVGHDLLGATPVGASFRQLPG
ncbi:dihydrodipicolinate synthase family protein [Auraticoccus sp. F435]|uniref:Dihydrodipicolinate synthase family protein n=1 Tax=Auraticoccus cholistanensis TaxID=2656650 RepID=A0A6A9UVP7_9ACTN|nr:dihydrodipicolinate synthase family protein [Auraticoccus cholistanensis]MVA75712.1 dihydrodipicolinate synthase family protein [Auraticoccus cholistanensis]